MIDFRKLAFDRHDAERVLRLAKARQLPKGSRVLFRGLGAAVSNKLNLGDAIRKYRLLHGDNSAETRRWLAGKVKNGVGHYHPSGSVIVPGKGDLIATMKSALHPKAKPGEFAGHGYSHESVNKARAAFPRIKPEHNKMFHAIMKGHELDEISVKGRLGTDHFGHRSPDVIFREHNRIVTLPHGHEDIQEFMRHSRHLGGESGSLFPKGLEYGKGQRLSRHARKRLTELAEKKTISAHHDQQRRFAEAAKPIDRGA